MRRYYTVLCEDLQAWVFVYRALLEIGVERRDIRRIPFPDNRFHATGGGPRRVEGYMVYPCGSQHVRESFAGELAVLRRQQRKGRDVALVVHVDVDNTTADGRSVQDRHRELDGACALAQPPVPRREEGDQVAWIVPRRAIETWIHLFLSGAPVDEHTEYRHLTGHEADAEPAAISFARHASAGTIPPMAPPSLVQGLRELRRVL
jgi:hypothetical protein